MSRRTDIYPSPTSEEAAAIMAVLETMHERAARREPRVSRWELSGRMGRVVPVGRKLESSPWSYPRLEEGF
jgi:hypothetical protein